MKTIVSFL